MNRDPVGLIVQWKQAEQGTDPELADHALLAVARHWPRARPPAGLAWSAIRHLAARPATRQPWTLWWVRVAIAVSVLVAGGALSWQPRSMAVSLGQSAFEGVIGGMRWLFWAGTAWIETVAAVGRPLAKAALVVGPALTEPGPVLFCLLNILLAAGALAVLRRVVVSREV